MEEFSKIIVRTGQDGHVTRLDDIARIELGAETYSGSSRNNGEDSVNMAVYRLDDANAMEAMTRGEGRPAGAFQALPSRRFL